MHFAQFPSYMHSSYAQWVGVPKAREGKRARARVCVCVSTLMRACVHVCLCVCVGQIPSPSPSAQQTGPHSASRCPVYVCMCVCVCVGQVPSPAKATQQAGPHTASRCCTAVQEDGSERRGHSGCVGGYGAWLAGTCVWVCLCACEHAFAFSRLQGHLKTLRIPGTFRGRHVHLCACRCVYMCRVARIRFSFFIRYAVHRISTP